jgi:phosphomannomutase
VESGLAEIKDLVVNWSEPPPETAQTGSIRSVDIVDDYVDHLFRIVPAEAIGPLRVAVDGGNGMAGMAIHQVMDRIPVTMRGLYLEPDGSFPNHPADPLVPENLQDLETLMRTEGFDLGVAFDGDADRAVFLDDSAASIPGSTITSLVARRLLAEAPGSAVVHNLITSKAVPEIVVEGGGIPVRTRVGHSYIKQVMAETDAIFGGEHSGHYYFRANFRADSGMLAMLYLLQVMTEDHRPLSAIRADVERYAASGEINFTVADADAVIDRVEQSFPDAGIDRLDGLTVDMGIGWFNLRPSNTEPLLRLNAEAEDEKAVAALVARVTDIVENRT